MTENMTYCDKHLSSRKCIFFVVHADLREDSATVPTQQPASQRGTTQLVSSDARRSQARRRQLGRASLPSPIKREGHVGSALNAFVRRS